MPYGFRLSEVRSVERLAQERLAALNAADPLPVDPQEREGRGFIRTVIVAALTDGARRAQELAVYMGGLQGRAIVSASPVRRDRLAAEVAVLRLYLAEAAAAMAFVTIPRRVALYGVSDDAPGVFVIGDSRSGPKAFVVPPMFAPRLFYWVKPHAAALGEAAAIRLRALGAMTDEAAAHLEAARLPLIGGFDTIGLSRDEEEEARRAVREGGYACARILYEAPDGWAARAADAGEDMWDVGDEDLPELILPHWLALRHRIINPRHHG